MQKFPLNAHASISSKAGSLNFPPSFHIHPNLVYASSEGYSSLSRPDAWMLDNET